MASVVEGLRGDGGDGGSLGGLDVVGGGTKIESWRWEERWEIRCGGGCSCVGDAVVVGGEVVAAVGCFAEL